MFIGCFPSNLATTSIMSPGEGISAACYRLASSDIDMFGVKTSVTDEAAS